VICDLDSDNLILL